MFKSIINNFFTELYYFGKRGIVDIKYVINFSDHNELESRRYTSIQDFNRNIFLLRESFFEHFNDNTSDLFFKKEWSLFYKNNDLLHQLWLAYTHRPSYYLNNLYSLRQSQLYKIFNISENTPGVYKQTPMTNYFNVYWGFISFWKALKIWIFSLIFFGLSFYVLLVKRTGVLPQTLFFWVGATMLLYWILSGFVFFVKKYQYSRYTSVIQRFWRRTYILFWSIESCLLLVFFYLAFNSSQESFYMFDQGYFLKSHLFSWKIFLFKSILIVSLITYSYITLLNLKWSTFNKNIFNLSIITLLLLYLLWTEFYQIYWVSNFYANFTWLYDVDEAIWSLEWDARRTRILNHYIMILFLLKFWHIVFIFGCWVFFLLRSNELDTITYPLYSFNFQNFIILFIMTWLFMYPWFKHTFHWLSELPYFWFYVDTHKSFYKIFINDFILFYQSFINHAFSISTFGSFNTTDFINWFLFDAGTDTNVFIKSTIKNVILKNLI